MTRFPVMLSLSEIEALAAQARQIAADETATNGTRKMWDRIATQVTEAETSIKQRIAVMAVHS